VHEDNAPVTTARFSPNGRYILAFTLDSCIRLWDYVSGTCKKTYQGHINTKYSLGGAFGVGGSEGFIVSGSEDGEILFWDVRSKEVVQRVSGHEGVVVWVDTCPGQSGTLVSGGLDGTVRIWVDVNGDDDVHELKVEHENGMKPCDQHHEIVDITRMKDENGGGHDDEAPGEGMSVDGERSPAEHAEEPRSGDLGLEDMED
jgi:COMPASS component SWD3